MMWIKVLVAISVVVVTVWCLPEGRIVNGTKAEKYQYPFMVSLRKNNKHWCGGSIIAPKWILTVARCVQNIDSKELTIQYGLTEISEEGPNVIPIKRIICHHKYNNPALDNDIALLELRNRLLYNYRSMAPINLPEKNFEIAEVPEGESAVLAGWGAETANGPYHTNLYSVELKIYSDEECKQRFKGTGREPTINNICAGVDDGGKGACFGDYGTPLIYKGKILVGIFVSSYMSRPRKCALYPYPGVYMKVSHYIDWIHSQINES